MLTRGYTKLAFTTGQEFKLWVEEPELPVGHTYAKTRMPFPA